MNLANKIRQMPQTSGIYQYFDKDSKILYIGKAKNLKKRVKSYFALEGERALPAKNLSARIASMVTKIHDIKTIIVNSEQDALILENSLIKQLKPRYNVLLRDDKTYPYIVIDKSAAFPRLEVSRKVVRDKNLMHFGPYSTGLKEIMDSIYEIVPLVQKKSCLKSREACLFYQIKRCKAPCEGKISKIEYEAILACAIDLLTNPQKLIAHLTQKMHALSDALRFEEANKIKQRIEKISHMARFSVIDLAKLYNLDIFAIASAQNSSVVLKIFMREGKIISSDYYFISHNNNDIMQNYLYEQAILSHYKQNSPIKLDAILLPLELSGRDEIENFLHKTYARKINIACPKSGQKRQLVNLALKNAKYLLEKNSDDEILGELKNLLHLENIPSRIEVFDTSHHAFSDICGGMIVFENGAFKKDSYRRFNLSGSDEYAQMHEMLERRAADFSKNSPPDLWLLDGGAGQIHIAQNIIAKTSVNIDIVAIAKEKIDSKAHRSKGGAWDILRTGEGELRLNKNDKRLLFLQKLRDEAHRYAISFHRAKKTKNLTHSGFTPAQTKKLLSYFGSFEALKNADTALIKKVLKQ